MADDKDQEIPYNLKPLMEGLESGEIQYMEPEDKFSFDCLACGSCCMNKDVLVNPHDIWMLFESGVAETLKITSTEQLFEGKYAPFHLTLGGNSGAPVCMIEFRPVSEPEEGKEPWTICPFAAPVLKVKDPEKMKNFSEANYEDPKEAHAALLELTEVRETTDGIPQFLCALHSAKPTICRAYPIGRAGDITQKAKKTEGKPTLAPMRYIKVPQTCGKTDTEWTVQGWVDKRDLKARYAGSDLYYKFIELVAVNKDKLPEEVRWAAANILYNFDMWGARDIEGMTCEKVMETATAFIQDFLTMASRTDNPSA